MPFAIAATDHFTYPAAKIPTMYFIGVSTGKSSIMSVFPHWIEHLGLGGPEEIAIQGIDCKLHDAPRVYRQIVEHIKADPLSRGALVTTHKIDLLKASRELFDQLDPYAQVMGEVSSISKRGELLIGHAKDPITSGLSAEAFLPANHWADTGSEVLVLGAGGSSIAFTSYLMRDDHGGNRPSRIVVTNRSEDRLEEIQSVHARLGCNIPVEYHHTPSVADNDALVSTLKPHSLVANATGLGKDAPGSPISDSAIFPENGFAWDFNYRGELLFLRQAQAQQSSRSLHVEDGWIYFVHGWTRVIAEVFDLNIQTSGREFQQLSEIAAQLRQQ